MNYKKKNFLITNTIVLIFVLIISLLTNYLLSTFIGFDKDSFMPITISVLVLGVFLYLLLSKPILEPIFKSDENLQKTVKETLHELNIPISTIKLNTQMLEKQLEDKKALKRLDRIKQASNELLRLYEDMEYNIKKEIDKVDIDEFDLKELLLKCIDKVLDIKGDIKIDFDMESTFIKTDKNGFEKVIDNLLSNAIKYNLKENGEIKISYDNKQLKIFNTGKEIDTKNLFIVFDKYFQIDSSKHGFGLGLNIVKEFCDKHKITIRIEPTSSGNTFILNLSNQK